MTENVVNAFLATPYGQKPAEKVYWKALTDAIRESARLVKDPRIRILTADEHVHSLRVKESVQNLIDRCALTVAVISGRNPNVFWEIGYTEAQGKPVVYLMDEDTEDLSSSPILVAEALKCPYRSADLGKIGMGRKAPSETALKLKAFLRQGVDAALGSHRAGRPRVLSNREQCELPALVAGALDRIYLITTNLSYFANDEQFVINQEGKKVFAFDSAVQRDVDVQILTMDPESPMVKYRAEQLNLEFNVSGFREDLRRSARKFYHRYRDRSNVTLRLYDDLPLQISLIVDSDVMFSVMSRGRRSRKNLHFMLDLTTPGAREAFEEHFKQVAAAPSQHISAFEWVDQT